MNNFSIQESKIKAARVAVSVIFFVNGMVLASWVPHIPYVQTKFSLSEGALGLVLLSIACGSVGALIFSGWLTGRFGSRTVTAVAALILCAALPLPILAPSVLLLVLALLLFGAAIAAMDVAMNAQGVAVEQLYGSAIMSSLHGLFSIGGLAGAALGGLALSMGISPSVHVIAVAVTLAMVCAVALRYFLPAQVDISDDVPAFAIPRGPVIALSLLAFFTLVAEGAMADWSAVYLGNWLGAEAGLAAAGFAAFSLMMAAGRLTGDFLVERFSPVTVVRVSAAFAAVGLGLSLLAGHPLAAIAGFGSVGLGLANVVPVLFSAAGRVPGISAGSGIAAVATVGYFGLLVGPPVIGFVAELVTLPGALGLVALSIGLVAIFANKVRRTKPEPAPEVAQSLLASSAE